MALFDRLRVRRAADAVLSTPHASDMGRAQAQALLKRLRARAVPILLEDLAGAPSHIPLQELLGSLLDNSTLPAFRVALIEGDQRLVECLTQLMSQAGRFDASQLLEWFQDSAVPKSALISILSARKDSLDKNAVARLFNYLGAENQVAIFRLLESVATPDLIPTLTNQLETDDWRVRLSIVRTLCRLGTAEAREVLTRLLADPNKTVRLEALEGLASLRPSVRIEAIAGLLRDPDLTVQSKAIEIVIELNDPRSLHYLLEVLQDESEYVRRAAVEVLNKIGNASTIKDLLDALRDKDWWVRVRAADALGSIGGPKVVQAALSLLRDEDEFIRRCAIEILNTAKSEQAFDALLEALQDGDWWVRERAVDALAALGDRRAVPVLIGLLESHPDAIQVLIPALTALADSRAVPPLLAQLASGTDQVAGQVLAALPKVTDQAQSEQVMEALRGHLSSPTTSNRDLAAKVLAELTGKFRGLPAPRAQTPAPAPVSCAPTDVLSILTPSPCSGVPPTLGTQPLARAAPAASSPKHSSAAQLVIDATALEQGMVLAERYRVIRQIRGGAFGVVVLVEDLVLGEEVILKFLRPHLASDEKIIRRFMQELRCARKISHDNVIRIHDFLALGKSYAISMEYFASEPLSAEIERLVRIPPLRALRILSDTCEGMIAAHNADVVHRDLKPANILIDEHDQVKIVDFGVAAAASYSGTRLTATGMVVGTPTYMSPEQIRGQEFDARADIYSLGVITYEMLTGQPPYVGDDPISILYQHLEGKVVAPRALAPDIPPAIEAIVLKAMAADPSKRYQTTEELRASLGAHLQRGAA